MINEIKRMQQLAGLNEIKIRRPNSINDIVDFYNEHIGFEWDEFDNEDTMPDWGGQDNLHDVGPQEFSLVKFLSIYEGMLSKDDIILLWLYCFEIFLYGADLQDIEEQLTEQGYSDDDIDYFIDTIQKNATST